MSQEGPVQNLIRCLERLNIKHVFLCFLFFVLDSSSSAPRMHFAPTTPQATAVIADQASMETGATAYLKVRAAQLMSYILFQS